MLQEQQNVAIVIFRGLKFMIFIITKIIYEINRNMFMQKKANDSDFDCGAFYDKINGKRENIREIQ